MTAKLVVDVFYAAQTLADGTRQDITIRLREEGEAWSQTGNLATLSREIKGEGAPTYKTGFQSIRTPEDESLLKFETYFRQDPADRFEDLMELVDTAFTGNLNANTAWMDTWGLRLVNGADAGDIIPTL